MKRCQGCGKEADLITGLGGVLLCRDECQPDAEIYIEEAREAGGQVNVTVWARRRYNRLHDNTRTERVTRRNDELNAKAQGLGYDSLSQMLTAWKNDDIEITVKTRGGKQE